jgi:2-keto-3-deoxy-L-rhamnonate aldolase RhmA
MTKRLVLLSTVGFALLFSFPAESQPRSRKLIRLLQEGKVAFGSFVRERTPAGAAALAANEDLDFLFYDLERGEVDVEELGGFLKGIRSADDPHTVLVRIAPIANDPELARRRIETLVEVGVDGVALPHVMSVEEARTAIDWIEQATDRMWPGNPEGDFLSFLMIEDPDVLSQASAIVGTNGVSIASPGPGSLRQAYGGDMDAVAKAVETVLSACKQNDVPCANTASERDIEDKVRRGFRVLITQGEALALGRAAAGRN